MLNPKPQLLTVGADSEHRRAKDAAVPLHWAAFFGHVAIVEALLESGADPGCRNNDGQTPLDVATNAEVREVLIRGTEIEFDEDEQSRAVRTGTSPAFSELKPRDNETGSHIHTAEQPWVGARDEELDAPPKVVRAGRRATKPYTLDLKPFDASKTQNP
mmetsp:Transcript_43061/g.69251  ORF Transcript_43061/g.69251 Transcript_43061/m.69251 type:complete len:159 (-) Transcript_43061:1672-2148(-)